MVELNVLNSMDEIKQLVDKVRQRRIGNDGFWEYYRGQGRPEYKLISNVSRGLTSADAVHTREDHLINNFVKKIKGRNLAKHLRGDGKLDDKKNLWNIYIQAQHYGIPTRLLDWSLKWEVGLWFAVESPGNDDVDGQFWIFTVPREVIYTDDGDNSYLSEDIKKLNGVSFINAPIHWSDEYSEQIAEVRRARQHGKFSIAPVDKSFTPLNELPEMNGKFEMYIIPSAIKPALREELNALDFNDEWLYYREHSQKEINEILEEIKSSK